MRTSIATMIGLLLGAAACGGSADGTGDAADPPAEAQTAAAARDACEILTAADLQPYFTEPLTARPGTRGQHQTKCEYWADDFRAGFSVLWVGGKDEFEMRSGAADAAADMMAKPGVSVDSIVKPGPVAGLGDRATFSDLMPSTVLIGDRMLEFQIMLLPESKAAFVPLAKKALSRMQGS